jgi:hypothetical protein
VKLASTNLDGLVNLAIRIVNTVSQTSPAKTAACNLLFSLAEILKPVAELVVPVY